MRYDKNHLRVELYECKLEDCGTVSAYLCKLKEIKDKLGICGKIVTADEMIFQTFHGLPGTPEWKTWKMITESKLSPHQQKHSLLRTAGVRPLHSVRPDRPRVL